MYPFVPLYCQHAFEAQQGNSLRSSGSGKTNTVVRHVCVLCLKEGVAARQRLVRRALDVRVAAFKTVFIGCGTLFKVEVVLMLQSLNGLLRIVVTTWNRQLRPADRIVDHRPLKTMTYNRRGARRPIPKS